MDPKKNNEEEIHIPHEKPLEDESAYAEDHKEDYYEEEILTIHHRRLSPQ